MSRDRDNQTFELRHIRGQSSSQLSDEETVTGSPHPSVVKRDKGLEEAERGRTSEISAEQAEDPNVVDWDGPDDPQNPINFPSSIKWGNIGVLSVLSTLTPLASSMFAPSVPQLMEHFHSTSATLATMIVSIYVLGFAFGPLVVGPLSEMYGRLWIFQISNIGYTLFTIACALAPSLASLIAFRFLAGCFGIAPLTVGGGTISDLIPQEERGKAMAIWSIGPILGPVIGPVVGGFLADAEGWRWIFWLLSILSGVATLASFFILKETYPVTLLARKVKRLQKETGNTNLRSKLDLGLTPYDHFRNAIFRPMKMMFSAPICVMVTLYSSTIYGCMYLLFSTFTYVFEETYHFSPSVVGLSYLGLGIGSILGVIIGGGLNDRILKSQAAKSPDGKMKPESRMVLSMCTVPLIPIGFIIYGWTAEHKVHWIAPQIGTVLIGIGLIISGMGNNMYLIDVFTLYSASAIAANTVLRSVFGGTFPLFGLDMYNKIGLGWGNTLLAFITGLICLVPWALFFFGERIRTRFPANV